MMLKRLIPLIFLLLALIVSFAAAQDAPPESPAVYVTVQDNTALRAGPGRHWDKLAVLPYGTTYRATGRTIDGDWLQVAYEGDLLNPRQARRFTVDGVAYGWVAYWLLAWSGDILQLPIDGVKTVATAREAGPTITIGPGLYMYDGGVDPSTQVDYPLDGYVQVEVTGRLGTSDAGDFLLQFKLNNRYYWTGTWALGGAPAGYLELPDAGYLFPYSRLLIELRSEAARAGDVLADIGGRWRALDSGRTTTCNAIPDDFQLRRSSFSATDLNIEPIYRPTAEALVNAQTSINAALAQFRQVCALPDRQVRPEDIRAALDQVGAAERYLTLVDTLLAPLQRADPIFAGE